ncbi:exodeoxyribonuclease VII large subunit [Aestuariibacter salexigens]|uniref:exodeoxyribonuclease VII large subunit n=1 Tax=Aestuariibacter salexigens TaxID=226010 RepID=UPI0004796421|nr:exodeoxyribonuclease VII large subunit [Aestuariibacter salexigens]
MFGNSSHSRNILSVSKLNRLARSVLESEVGAVWLSAEISNFVAAASGHWYFTLKDERAQIRAAMFKGANRRVQKRPKEGDKVLVHGSLGLYEPRGDYQLIVDSLEPEGDGLLKQQFEQLKIKLSAEGLFSNERKKPLPQHIRRIGIVTSPTGAAVHDILTVLKRRNPAISVIIYPSQVQGDMAEQQLCRAIETANRRNEVDVLIVGRGGGSLEDLWSFNLESVARSIANSAIPLVSAVGHEIDVSIADFVADVRAPTPSAAAELVSTDSAQLSDALQQTLVKLQTLMQKISREHHYRQQVAFHRLQQNHPRSQLNQQSQRLDRQFYALKSEMARVMTTYQNGINAFTARLTKQEPSQRLASAQQHQTSLLNNLSRAMQSVLKTRQAELGAKSQLLDSVSPLATMARGYSITFQDGNIVRSVTEVKSGQQLTTRVADGEIHSKIM